MKQKLQYEALGGVCIALGIFQVFQYFPNILLTINGILLLVLGVNVISVKGKK
ncbi:hypothetical protein J4444_02370 [Candidatus Woesearchaeota archaeon]|nr:hypothetical protein [Candidatus Woesearchaeota archaeon]